MPKHTYLALSTTNYKLNGYTVYGIASTKEAAQKEAINIIKKSPNKDVLIRNLNVVSKTVAKETYGIHVDEWIKKGDRYQYYLESYGYDVG